MDRFLSDLRVKLGMRLSKNVMRTIRPFLTVQFIIFMFMGMLNTCISVAMATLLDILHTHFLPAESLIRVTASQLRLNFIFGYAVSIVTSFFLNLKFTFHQKPTWKKFIRFPISYIPNFIFQYIFVFLFTAMGWNSTIAYICAAIVGTPITFAAIKLFVFRHKKQSEVS